MVFQNFESVDGTYYSREKLPENAYSRIEQYLRELCLLEGSPLPVPKTRIEKLLNCLVTGENDFEEPQSRIEGLIYALITGDESNIETCASRVEVLWYMLVKDLDAESLLGTEVNGKVVEDCFSRVESYLWNLLRNGGLGGSELYEVLYELNNQVTMYNTITKSVNNGTLLGNTMVNIVGDNVTAEGEVTGTESFEHDEDSTIKSAILHGSTKYRDIDTGDILDKFDKTKNLELIGCKMPVLTTSNEGGTKTNILTVNEPVELRAIGKLKDELNLLTGELIQRIGVVVLDGSEDWQIDSDTNDYRLALALDHNGEMLKYTQSICDKYPTETSKQSATTYNYVYVGGTSINLYENPSMTLEEFKSKLKQNPMTFQYQLTTESIKTVDLSILNQDEVEVPNVTLFANGQITTSSEVLIPTLEYEFILNNQYELPALQSATYTIQNNGTPFTLNGVEYSGVEQKQLISVSNVTNKVLTTEDENMIIVKGNQLEENISTLEKRKLLAVKNPIITLSDENGTNSNSANFEGSFYKIPNFDADISNLNGETTRNSKLLSYTDLATTWTVNSTMASQFNTIGFISSVELLSSVANSVVGTYNNLFGDHKANDLFITDCEGVAIYNDQLCIRVNRARLETEDIDGLETYLATNEFECLYIVNEYTENIVVNGKLSSYDGITIATVSSENNVLPTVLLQVKTSNQEDLEAVATGYTLLESTQSETSTAIEEQEGDIQTVSDELSETSDLESIILEMTNQMEGE